MKLTDDDDPVTIKWCERHWYDSATSRGFKRYEICTSIRIVFNACVGGWEQAELWIGGGSDMKILKDIKIWRIRQLCRALGIEGQFDE